MAPADKPPIPVAEADVMAALRRISDPDRGGDIVSLGMVTGLAVRDGHVAFAIEVDPQRGPRLERCGRPRSRPMLRRSERRAV
jgi:hypothetical protein